MLASYAYSRNVGANAGNGFNLENWLQNVGPTQNDLTHVANLSTVARLPWHIDLGANFSYTSVTPFSAFAYVGYGMFTILTTGINLAGQTRRLPFIMGAAGA